MIKNPGPCKGCLMLPTCRSKVKTKEEIQGISMAIENWQRLKENCSLLKEFTENNRYTSYSLKFLLSDEI